MPKRSSKKLDATQNARRVVLESIESAEEISLSIVSQVMASMGRKGGLIGGKRRLETMTAEQRRDVASNAAKKRWAKAKASKKTTRQRKTA